MSQMITAYKQKGVTCANSFHELDNLVSDFGGQKFRLGQFISGGGYKGHKLYDGFVDRLKEIRVNALAKHTALSQLLKKMSEDLKALQAKIAAKSKDMKYRIPPGSVKIHNLGAWAKAEVQNLATMQAAMVQAVKLSDFDLSNY